MPVRIYGTSIYCRASREDGDKLESNTIASQRSICEDYIASHSDLVLIDEPYFEVYPMSRTILIFRGKMPPSM